MFDTIFATSHVILLAAAHGSSTASHSKTTGSSSSGGIIYLVFMVLIVYVGWRLIFRPQSQRAKQQRQAMLALSAGDDIITTAGIYGTVLEIDGDKLHVRVSDNCVLTMARGSVAQRLTAAAAEEDVYESGSDGQSDGQDLDGQNSLSGSRSDGSRGESSTVPDSRPAYESAGEDEYDGAGSDGYEDGGEDAEGGYVDGGGDRSHGGEDAEGGYVDEDRDGDAAVAGKELDDGTNS